MKKWEAIGTPANASPCKSQPLPVSPSVGADVLYSGSPVAKKTTAFNGSTAVAIQLRMSALLRQPPFIWPSANSFDPLKRGGNCRVGPDFRAFSPAAWHL